MKILAIDTSSDICSVAVLEDRRVIKQFILEDKKTHSQMLMPLIDNVLKICDLSIDNIDLFTCSKGPGSFTGIRIGISTINAFSDVTNKNMIGISSLKGLAYNINNVKNDDYICSLIDAKHENVYFGLFECQKGVYTKVMDYGFDTIEHIIILLKQLKKRIIFVGNGGILYQDMIKSQLEKNAIFIEDEEINKQKSSSIGLAAFDKISNGIIEPIVPLYLKKSSAETLWEDKNK